MKWQPVVCSEHDTAERQWLTALTGSDVIPAGTAPNWVTVVRASSVSIHADRLTAAMSEWQSQLHDTV